MLLFERWNFPKSALSVSAATLLAVALLLSPGVAFSDETSAHSSNGHAAVEEDDALLRSLEGEYEDEEAAAVRIGDPIEPVNRAVFGFNLFLDRILFKPVAHVYRWMMPETVRTGVTNVVNNSYAPVTIFNSILQGDRQKFGDAAVRFLLNTTIGVGGLLDVASAGNLPQHYEDFGQTLAVHGAPSGPYLVVPILGPSSPRHLVGRAADYVTNPLTWLLWDVPAVYSSIPTATRIVAQREANIEAIDGLEESSLDFYEAVKSVYVQNRRSAIGDAGHEAGLMVNPAGARMKPVHENARRTGR